VDGLLIIDKPAGPTSHDVVMRLRRVLGERRIGHTGTLDPAATGVLPLVVGRATRLARFLSAGDKSYKAVIRLGVSTDTADAAGAPIGSPFAGPLPSREAIDGALQSFRGTFLQQPPLFSAKKIGGQRSHRLARSRSAVESESTVTAMPAPVTVTVYRLDLVSVDADRVTLTLDCSAGFYVRSLAHDLGQALGTGAHLERLRRTRSGDCTLAGAIELASAEQDRDRAKASIIPLSRMLPAWDAVVLTIDGVRHASQGRNLGPADISRDSGFGIRDSVTDAQQRESQIPNPESRLVRLLDPAGDLIGIGEPAGTSWLLHPLVVLI
jgi:tRNA pseudouridine55 synthase